MIRRKTLIAYLLAYTALGIYGAWWGFWSLYDSFVKPFSSFGNATLHAGYWIPLLLAGAGWISLQRGRSATVPLVLVSLLWIYLSGFGGVQEDLKWMPILVVACVYLVHLIVFQFKARSIRNS